MGNYCPDFTRCTQEFEDGSVFHGQCRKGMFHGQGHMRWANFDDYKGQYVDGLMEGQGVYTHATGERYQGQFRGSLRDGYGVFTFTDGALYDGEWVADKPEGEARVIYPGGEIIISKFRNGVQDLGETQPAYAQRKVNPTMANLPLLPPLPESARAPPPPNIMRGLPSLPVLAPHVAPEPPHPPPG